MGDFTLTGIWAVIHCGSRDYIGKLKDYKTDQHEEVKTDVAAHKLMKLAPVLDFFSPLTPVQGPQGQRGLQRQPVVTPYGFTTSDDAPLYVRVDAIAFLDEMSSEDRKLYAKFIETALDQMQATRAERMGITLASKIHQ